MQTHSPYRLTTLPYLTALVCAFPLSANAQTGDIPKPVIQNLSKDLSQLQQAVLDAEKKSQVHDVAANKDGSRLEKLNVTAPTYIRAGAAEDAPMVTKASAGERYQVIDKVGYRYAITIPSTVKGIDSGWVSATAAVPMPPQKNSQISEDVRVKSVGSPSLGDTIRSNIDFNVPTDWNRNDPAKYSVTVFPDGTVRDIQLISSSGLPGFDAAVRKAIEASEPYPVARLNGSPPRFVLVAHPLTRFERIQDGRESRH